MVEERLASIETKLDLLLTDKEDKESRLRSLERRFWVAVGGLGILGFFKEPILRFLHL